jgi:TMEM175 potassium channel family protein
MLPPSQRPPMFDSEAAGSARTRNLDRLIALVDGIFAVAMTLLVLDLKLPADRSLADALQKMLPGFAIYLITFASVVGYWYMHHSTFQYVARVNGRVIVLSMLGMLFVTLFPLSASIVGAHPLDPLATMCLSLNSALYCVGMWGLWSFLAAHRELLHPGADTKALRGIRDVMGVIAIGLVVAVPLAYLSPFLAYGLWTVFPALVGWGLRGRHERHRQRERVG